jgi:hypothetical protein
VSTEEKDEGPVGHESGENGCPTEPLTSTENDSSQTKIETNKLESALPSPSQSSEASAHSFGRHREGKLDLDSMQTKQSTPEIEKDEIAEGTAYLRNVLNIQSPTAEESELQKNVALRVSFQYHTSLILKTFETSLELMKTLHRRIIFAFFM